MAQWSPSLRREPGVETVARHLDLRLLAQLMVICETGKMSTAARRLGLSAPAVSQLVQKLERDLGITLFERSSHGLRSTPAGAILHERAVSLLAEEKDILQELEGYRSQLLPKLRIYIADSVARYIMPGIVAELRQFVGQLEVKSGRSTQYVQEFLKNHFDALISSEPLGDVPGIDRHNLCSERLIGLAPAGVATARRGLQFLAGDLPFIRPGFGSRMDRLIEGYLASEGLNPARGIECSSVAPILEMVASGVGWTLSTPLSVAYYQPDPEQIAIFGLPGNVPSRQILLLTHEGKLLDVPSAIAASSSASIRAHVALWPRQLDQAISFPNDLRSG
ncbi:LysR family transcriptional regulator [Jiella sp. M17.18]|uniref:LysR family transcriptional regulator n=1 Tax=Jiella sp. M17.18 TaxID=3234247 RepID=UPI0034DFA5FD